MKHNSEVRVALRNGKPHLVSNAGHTYFVEFIDREWEEREHWWSRKTRRYYRLLTNRAVLIVSEMDDEWSLSSIMERPESN